MVDELNDAEEERTFRISSADVRAARRLLGLLLGLERQTAMQFATERVEDGSRAALIARAREELGNRQRRIGVFGSSMFGEAAWDMLLSLYILDVTGQRQTVGNLTRFAGTSPSSALRWLNFLCEHDFTRREPHPTDKRTEFVSLTPKAREKLDSYFSETVQTAV